MGEEKCRVQTPKSQGLPASHGSITDIKVDNIITFIHQNSCRFWRPFILVQGRGKCRLKCYLCLFTYLATRAVHLEAAFGLDTDSFLNALYRMTSRRGLPEVIYSDNGTNFKSADKELKSLISLLHTNKINESIANKGIQWNCNPPLAPHFGGVHESMLKSAKKAISAILGNADITDEELITAVTGAEGLINSRALTYQSANLADDVPLAPNHFLHGQIGEQFAQHQPTKHNTIRGRDGARYKNLSGTFGIGGSASGCLLSASGRNGTRSIGMSK